VTEEFPGFISQRYRSARNHQPSGHIRPTQYAPYTISAEGRTESNQPALTVTAQGGTQARGQAPRGPRGRAQGRTGAERAAEAGHGPGGAQRGAPGRRMHGCPGSWPKDMLPSCGLLPARQLPGGQSCRVVPCTAVLGPARGPGGRRGGRLHGLALGQGLGRARVPGDGGPDHPAGQAAGIRPEAPFTERDAAEGGLRPVTGETPFGQDPVSQNILRRQHPRAVCRPSPAR